ncbi:MAG: N-acetylmuramoyl-L-alanine amidase [Bacteroidales bacterium]|nr:N-acetylmuramoyl-L-alanine amidase [Bacteroidales bacterium]
MRRFALILGILAGTVSAAAQGIPRAADFSVVCDTLTARCNRRFQVVSRVRIDKIYLRGEALDLYFANSLSDYPWHSEDILWFLSELNTEGEKVLQGYNVGSCMTSGCRLEELETPSITRNGRAPSFHYLVKNSPKLPLVHRIGARKLTRGLEGRHIALWQSHGYYFNEEQGVWRWQRATLHRTVEDMYTQGYVLDYLIPMLENAGACVLTPRERDVQRMESVCDNDSTFIRGDDALVRTAGVYSESGAWEKGGEGFADLKQVYNITDNPFRLGTCRKAACSITPASVARWTPAIPLRGEYAVYVSYGSGRNNCKSAHYTVHHLGGKTEFEVDQRKGGGTWVYLGTFEFSPEGPAFVELDNKGASGEWVSADAVRFGGGMGKIQRGGHISGMPSYVEGASYWMPWAGADSTLREWETDYVCDYATRGSWTRMMRKTKGVPFDCSLAFHTDAGVTPNDSIVGTLSIYTLKCDNSRKFSDGSDRMTSRTYADFVQTQVVEDIRKSYEPKWQRRQLWDRSYSESRTTDVPAMLLELLSHQNFADMKYGLDPAFRFTVGRAVYKGLLKYLSCRYGVSYAVQPLPVQAFSALLNDDGEVQLSWAPTPDPLEPTAAAKGYTVYTRVDDGAFDEGVPVSDPEATMQIVPGHVYSYKVVAWNDGGDSFPSEVLSVGMPVNKRGETMLIVNNFDRVAPPAWIDTPEYAGFDSRLDNGMPYIRDITYIGENYEFTRPLQWESDDAPGFGGSYSDKAGVPVAGNTFDYPSVHGRALLNLGFPFCSMSCKSFCADTTLASRFGALDLICGAQLSTKSGRGAFPARYSVFPEYLQSALRVWARRGGSILVSGSRIATDVWGDVYGVKPDPAAVNSTKEFIAEVLGYRWASSYGTNTGELAGMPFYCEINEHCYAVPHPDGLRNSDSRGSIWLRYGNSGVPAAVKFNAQEHKAVSIGVPLECMEKDSDRERLFREVLEFFGLYGPSEGPGSYQFGFLYFTPANLKVLS